MSNTALFLATLAGQTLDEAMASLELDAKAYGWTRAEVREAAHKIRLMFARKAA
jgi:hypothetical protein